jgi:copper chaperone CopZ
MRTTATIPTMRSEYAKQAVFTALTPLEGIVRVELASGIDGGTLVVEHDGRVTADALRAAVAVSGHDITAIDEDRRTLALVHPEEDA